ncbi:RBBP9/YdeN family alpha/beta hydrolase [Herbiconiux sp. P15]|uniref:RBBP9/YdeN family alpha/beta hydrolase n=1 Tax=Herbiconiux liukaitaii TaxID=3342799 RepID=UPI0035BA2851
MTSSAPGTPPLRRVVVVHGYNAYPTAHWFPWLGEQLDAQGVEMVAVELPTPATPVAEEWEQAVAAALGVPDETTWVVTHSLGGITALRVLAALPPGWRLGGLVLVSGFTGRLPSLPVLDDFLADDVDAEALVGSIGVRQMIRSDDDTNVPPASSDRLAQRLDAGVHVQEGAGHFLAAEGITSLPLLTRLLAESGALADRPA